MSMNILRDNNWIWANCEEVQKRNASRRQKRAEAERIRRTKKPESGKYWIVTSVKEDMPYYLTDVERRGSQMKAATKDVTYTWKPKKLGMDEAMVFLNEDEAWEMAYACRGTVIAKIARKKTGGNRNAADEG